MAATATLIAIPARNEADQIERCLACLDRQRDLSGAPWRGSLRIIVLANNCDDDTAMRARAVRMVSAQVDVIETTLPPERSHAGQARAQALDAAMAMASGARASGARPLLMTTDADSRVSDNWLAQAWREIGRGADAVAGWVDFHGEDGHPDLPAIRQVEARYADRQAHLTALIDPIPHDPWPNHLWAWGANIALRPEAYAAAGSIGDIALAEDRMLISRLIEKDFRVRHSLSMRVRTSARRVGRAPGGLADLMNDYRSHAATPCDIALEPFERIVARSSRRRCFRAEWLTSPKRKAGGGEFGLQWAELERGDPGLASVRLLPADLERNLALIEAEIARRVGRDLSKPRHLLW